MPTTYAIPDGRTVMAATLYTGTGAAMSVSNAVNGVSFQPDWVWIKSRSNITSHGLFDVNRGVRNVLQSNATSVEALETAGTSLTSFDSGGFALGTNGSTVSTNVSAYTFVGWQWKAGGTAVSNTSGSITSTVSAGATQGFSVVTFTAQTSGTATVGHGLGVAPSLIITKVRNGTSGWTTYHSALGNTKYIVLNETAAAVTLSTAWNNTSPSSTVFTLGSAFAAASQTMVAYCFAPVAGYSAFGSYTGNNSADGPFVYLGFRPRWIMFKDSSAVAVWMIMDTARNTINVLDDGLAPNNTSAESTYSNTAQVDFLSNGFKIRATNANQYWANISGNTYIYAAFAENPFKYANAC
jgi:hypothetical protein